MNIVDLIKKDEGLRLHVYDDATGEPVVKGYTLKGHPTIGYGRLLTKGRGITLEEAQYFLDRDLQETITELSQFDWFNELDSIRADVIMSMAFNMGLTRFLKFQNTIFAIKRKDWDTAADEILDSNAARQLPERYGRLADMMRTGHEST